MQTQALYFGAFSIIYYIQIKNHPPDLIFHWKRDLRGRNRIVVRFTSKYAISAYRHWNCEFDSHSLWACLMKVIPETGRVH
jgi:hypothetical protein